MLNQIISIRLSILDNAPSGTAIYVETHAITTNNSGLFNLSIGTGAVISGNFSAIDWGVNSKWLKTEMDASGGSIYQFSGTTQFLSVPYSLFSGASNTSIDALKYKNEMETLLFTSDGF